MSKIVFDNADEELLFSAQESWVPVFVGAIPMFLICLAACVATFIFAAAWLIITVAVSLLLLIAVILPPAIDNWRTDAAVTNRRFYYRRGIIDVKDHVTDLGSITDVTVDPNIFGRLFDYANVRIQTKAGDDDFVLHDISHAYEMRRIINTQKDSLL